MENIAGRRAVGLAGGRSENDLVAEDVAGRAGLYLGNRRNVAAEPLAQIYASVGAECLDGSSGARIDLLQVAVGRKNQPPIGAIFALPVVHPAVDRRAHDWMRPESFARCRIERNDRVALAENVHHTVDDQRVEIEPGHDARNGIKPGLGEMVRVGLIDLRERGILHRIGAAAVVGPVHVVRFRLLP